MTPPKPQIMFWGLSLGALILAQVARLLADTLVYNEHLAFSLEAPSGMVIPMMLVFLVGVVVWFYSLPRYPLVTTLAFAGIAGGGGSNLLERFIFDGRVADYWNAWGFFTFNLADGFILLGIVGLMLSWVYESR